MTLSTVFTVALGRSTTLQERLTLQEALNVQDMNGLVRFAGTVLKLTLAFELAGALVLALLLVAVARARCRPLWHGLFHAVSAFNNAGFALWSDNLMSWRGDVVVNLVITALIIAGGLGFFVWTELLRGRTRAVQALGAHAARRGRHGGAAGGRHAGCCWRSNGTTRGRWPDCRLASSCSPPGSSRSRRARRASTRIDIGAMTVPSLFVMMGLMFIGASPGSTGGGVKTSTFSITLAALWATVRGANDTVIFKRRLAPELVAKAFFISLIAFVAMNGVAWLLLLTEGRELLDDAVRNDLGVRHGRALDGRAGAPGEPVGVFSRRPASC